MKRLEEIKTAKELIKELEDRGYTIEKTKIRGRYRIGTKVVRFKYCKYINRIKFLVLHLEYRKNYEPREYWTSYTSDNAIETILGKPY